MEVLSDSQLTEVPDSWKGNCWAPETSVQEPVEPCLPADRRVISWSNLLRCSGAPAMRSEFGWLKKLSPTVLFCLTEFSETNTRHAGAVDGYESRGSISAWFRETQDPQMFVIKTSISSHRVPCGTSVHFPWLFCISQPQSLRGAGPQ